MVKKVINSYYTLSTKSNQLTLLSMISATWLTRIIYFAVKTQVFEKIDQGICQVEEISDAVNVNKMILLRFLKGLVHVNLLKQEDNKFYLTDLSNLLLIKTPGNFSHMALLWGEEFSNAWGKIYEVSQSGKSGFEEYYGQNIFFYLSQNLNVSNNFDHAMNNLAYYIYPEIVKELPLSKIKHIVDIGGGNGFLLKKILEKYKNIKSTLFDLEHVIQNAEKITLTEEYYNKKNLHFESGDFFIKVPDADAHLLANVIHDWDDDKSLQILKNVRKAQKKGNKLFLVEMIIDHENEPILARSTDLNMLMLTGGKERSCYELTELLKKSGFLVEKLINIKDFTCIIIASAF